MANELIKAAQQGNIEMIARELNSGADINGYDLMGWTALTAACDRGHEAAVQLLISRGADLNLPSLYHRRTALMFASKNGHLSTVELLLTYGAEQNSQDNTNGGNTALHLACYEGHTRVAEILLRKGANHIQNKVNALPIELCKDGETRAEIQRVIASLPFPAPAGAIRQSSAPTAAASPAETPATSSPSQNAAPRLTLTSAPVGTVASSTVTSGASLLSLNNAAAVGSLSPNSATALRSPSSEVLTDVFLSHDWGDDGINHLRVSNVNRRLKAGKGLLTTWFDEERMQGGVRKAMRTGIENADVVVVFLTSRYLQKVNSDDKTDSCCYEFNYAFEQKTNNKMVVVVLEPSLRNPRKWGGAVGAALADNLYVDMCDEPISDTKIQQLKVLIRAAQQY